MGFIRADIDHERFLRQTGIQLLVIMVLMIACFFTWSENVAITRAIKVVGRMGVLLASYLVYRNIIKYGAANSFKWQNALSPLLYVSYLALGFISLLWSTNPGFSALQLFMTIQSLVFCFFFIKSLYLLDTYFPGHSIRLFNLLGNSAFILLLIFVLGMWVNPDTFYRMTNGGEEARLGGYLMNPNELGMLAGVGIAGLMMDLRRNHRKWLTGLKLIVLAYGLYATGSRSSLIGVLIIILFQVRQSASPRLKVMVLVGMLAVAPLAVNQVILKGGDSERMEELLTMTGRLPFWKALITEGLPREPLLGFGFMRIDYKEYFQSTHTYPGKMTHNTFLQVLMNLGFIGLTLVVFQMIFTFKGLAGENKEKRLMLYGFMIPIIINSFTEFGIFGESNYGILFYQLIILYISLIPNPLLTRVQRLHLRRTRAELQLA